MAHDNLILTTTAWTVCGLVCRRERVCLLGGPHSSLFFLLCFSQNGFSVGAKSIRETSAPNAKLLFKRTRDNWKTIGIPRWKSWTSQNLFLDSISRKWCVLDQKSHKNSTNILPSLGLIPQRKERAIFAADQFPKYDGCYGKIECLEFFLLLLFCNDYVPGPYRCRVTDVSRFDLSSGKRFSLEDCAVCNEFDVTLDWHGGRHP